MKQEPNRSWLRASQHGALTIVVLALMAAGLVACGGGASGGNAPSGGNPIGGGGGNPPADDGRGPTLACTAPVDGAILDQAPGQISLTGSVNDPNGVNDLMVNGAPVAFDASGMFSTTIDATWGINLVTLSAVDDLGREGRGTCAFLLADTWAPDSDFLSDTISLTAAQSAVDDNTRTGAINSFGDILHTVLNSSGLRDSLHNALLSANPLKPDACDSPGPFGTCLLSSRVRYLDLTINGPNSAALKLVDGGLSDYLCFGSLGCFATTTARDIRIRIRIDGKVAGIPYDTTGWVTFSSGRVDLVLDTALAQGKPSASLRTGSVSTTMGTISTSFSGLDGQIVNIVVDLFNGSVRDLVGGLIQDWVVNNFNAILDDLLKGLDISNLASTYDVPRLDGTGSIPVSFDISYSSLSTNFSRMLINIGTRFSTTPVHTLPTLGAPVPSGDRRLVPPTSSPILNALHVGLLNQALHALWRGGYFDGTFGGGALGGLVRPGATFEMTTGLPPAAQLLANGRAEIAMGAVSARLTDPALTRDPIDLRLGGRVSCELRLASDDLVLEACTVDQLVWSPAGAALDAATQNDVERFITDAVNYVAAHGANDAIPVLPIPAFQLPASLATYGLPAGEELGVVNPVLRTDGNYIVLEGAFGIR
jgi:hypothetical protein